MTQYKQEFVRLCATTCGDFQELYTDGSKREAGVGATVVGLGRVRKTTLPREASILSAEIHAIEMATKIIAEVNGMEFVVFSVSYNGLKCIEDAETQHPIARKIIHDIDRLQRETGKWVRMCWIPSHVGIASNEAADKAAVAATALPEEYICIYYKDWYPRIKETTERAWNEASQTIGQKMKEIKPEATSWKRIKTKNRREEVVINRLRAGHCLLLHGYLMDDSIPDIPPICEAYDNSVLTVKHIMVKCPQYDRCRQG